MTPPPATTWVIVFVALVALQRLGELLVSQQHEPALRAMGAYEVGGGHFPLIVAVHVLYPLCLLAEVLALGARPDRMWPLWLALVVACEAVRFTCVRTLGARWHVRIWVVPGMPLVRSGPYRFLRHPNYVAVVVELLAAPLMFGAWRTAIVISALDLALLAHRIRVEDAALAAAAPPALPVRKG